MKQKLTSPIDIKGHHVAASAENPQYLVVSDSSGEETAHKPEALAKAPANRKPPVSKKEV
ncbi:MAG: DUF2945 domain-containing protein [Caldilineaceae bacterium]